MPLAPGTQLGPYEITAALGAGGMGEVYRARDRRLERTVAIKVLPAQFSADVVRKQRFEREAKTISQLNHPHICTLHDIGSQDGIEYLVMECVDGETLAKRLEKGPLPLEQVLKYGAQIADALDKAHRAGIVHRDLKPGNIMLTAGGAKLLDFGLAKPAVAASVATMTVTKVDSPVTQEGTVLGTFQYMSPEQVEGKEVDGRSDIFSLGAVLYEAVTGRKAFDGKSQLSVASAILEKEPAPISTIKPLTPLALDHVIRKCLAKTPGERWQSACDLASEVKWIADTSSLAGTAASGEARGQGVQKLAVWSVGVALLLAVAGIFAISRHKQTSTDVIRYVVPPPDGGKFLFGGFQQGPVISPDGRKIAFIARAGGVEQVWVKFAESLQAQALPGTEDAYNAFWSSDSQNIAFMSGGVLKRVSLSGGLPRTICETDGSTRGGTWSREDVILFGSTPGPIYRVAASGGTPQRVTSFDQKRQDLIHRWPFFLPDGNHFLYVASASVAAHESNAVFAGSLDGRGDHFLFYANPPVFYANGHLLYLSGDILMARPFDPGKLEFTGEAVKLGESVLRDPYFGGAALSVSETGVLIYQQGKPFEGYGIRVFDRSGKQIAGTVEPGLYFNLRFSPDGEQIAYHSPVLQAGTMNVFVWDIKSGSHTRISFNSHYNRGPVWSPDGKRIAFVSSEVGTQTIFVKTVNSLQLENKLADLGSWWPVLTQWTPDGKNLLSEESTPDTRRLRIIETPLSGQAPSAPLLEDQVANVASGCVSPDGRWLAYRSTETGRSEAYVTSFPKPSGKIQVSTSGASAPRWRGDSKELYFMDWNHQMMAAELTESGGSLQVASLRSLFRVRALSSLRSTHYDVSPDGNRYAVLSVSDDEISAPVNVVINWAEELKKK